LLALEEAVEWEKQIAVANILQEMDNRGVHMANSRRQTCLKKTTEEVKETLRDLLRNPEMQGGWKQQAMLHGKKHDTMVHYRLNENQGVTVRLDTPIPASLIVPMLSILNETDLYTSWLPSFQRPVKLGVRSAEMLTQCSRGAQVARVRVDMPWPMLNREVVTKNFLADCVDELGVIVIGMKNMEGGQELVGFTVPASEDGWQRIGMAGALVFRRCPEDHPALQRHPNAMSTRTEPLVLASSTLTLTPARNFILKAIAGPMWTTLLSFAEKVQEGKSPIHKEAIDSKPELHSWVDEVVQRMTNKCS
jgi:hypothetical protein